MTDSSTVLRSPNLRADLLVCRLGDERRSRNAKDCGIADSSTVILPIPIIQRGMSDWGRVSYKIVPTRLI